MMMISSCLLSQSIFPTKNPTKIWLLEDIHMQLHFLPFLSVQRALLFSSYIGIRRSLSCFQMMKLAFCDCTFHILEFTIWHSKELVICSKVFPSSYTKFLSKVVFCSGIKWRYYENQKLSFLWNYTKMTPWIISCLECLKNNLCLQPHTKPGIKKQMNYFFSEILC
jgi:hypothetical protein